MKNSNNPRIIFELSIIKLLDKKPKNIKEIRINNIFLKNKLLHERRQVAW